VGFLHLGPGEKFILGGEKGAKNNLKINTAEDLAQLVSVPMNRD